MSTRTWNGSVDTNFQNVNNWDELAYAVPNDLIEIANKTAPATNRPTSGTFNFRVAINTAGNISVASWLGSGGVIGTVTVNHASANVNVGAATGAVTLTLGVAQTGYALGSTLSTAVGTTFTFTQSIAVAGDVTNAGTIVVGTSKTITFTGNLANTGTLNLSATGASADVNGTAGVTGAGGAIKMSATSVGTGILNVTNCTWTVAAGATWVVDLAGTINVGTANNLDVVFNAAGASFALDDANVRDATVTDGTVMLINPNCRVLTLGDGKTCRANAIMSQVCQRDYVTPQGERFVAVRPPSVPPEGGNASLGCRAWDGAKG